MVSSYLIILYRLFRGFCKDNQQNRPSITVVPIVYFEEMKGTKVFFTYVTQPEEIILFRCVIGVLIHKSGNLSLTCTSTY